MKAILKYQEGGDLSQFLIDYTPFTGIQRQQSTRTSTSSSTSTSDDDNDEIKNNVSLKDLLSLLKDLKGLPTEIEIISQKAYNMFEEMMLMNNGKISTNQLVTTYLSLLRDIKIAGQNEKMYEEKRKKIDAANGLNDPAIDTLGRVYVQDINTGEILKKTPAEYRNLLQSGNNYQALTNSQLLSLRQYDPNLAFKNDIFNIIDNGIGIDKVNELIRSITDKIGKTELENQGYSKIRAGQIVSGFEQLTEASKQGMSVDGLYRNKLISSTQFAEAKMALNYLWSTLPQNAKNRLRVASAEIGSNNIDQGAYNLIETFIRSGLTTIQKEIPTLVDDDEQNEGTSRSSSGSSSGSKSYGGSDDKSNPYFNMIKQLGGEYTRLNWKIGNVAMGIDGKHYSEITDINGKPVAETSIANLLHQGLGSVVTDKEAIVFGNKLLKSEDLKNIMYKGNGGTSVLLPCKKVDGKTVVDLSIMEEYDAACADIAKLPNPTDEQKAQIYIAHNLMQLVDQATGKPNMERFALFLVVDAIAVNKNDFLGHNSRFLEEITKPDDDLIEDVSRALSNGDGKKEKYEIDANDKIAFEGKYEELYKGVLYIPLTINELQARTAFDKNVKGYYDMEADYQRMIKTNSAQSANPQALGLTMPILN